MSLESYFAPFRDNIIGINQEFESPCGRQKILYADWTASGRMFGPIEQMLSGEIAPFVGNTHTETSVTGTTMTRAYHEALKLIKTHVNASTADAIICYGSGMTSVVNKFQRILGLRVHEKYRDQVTLSVVDRPIVFVTHMEHHSNQTSWIESVAEVRVIKATTGGLVDLDHLAALLEQYRERKVKIAAVTSCSNVSGLLTPYHAIAGLMHRAGGVCFVDFAASAPYIAIDMHPTGRPDEYLDAIYFSPHKFLGGPGTSGVLVFNKKLYTNRVPDNPGGGTVDWTNPWGEHKYFDDIEAREDGGTPGFTQAIRTALCIRLKEAMGVAKILQREHELLDLVWDRLKAIPGLHILADQHRDRLAIISFYIDDLHYNLAVRLLNDRYGIQTRGGCSCAGTYGHYLLHVSRAHSKSITEQINRGDKTEKPGWIRLSLHPTTTDAEALHLVEAIAALAESHRTWAQDYTYEPTTNEFTHRTSTGAIGRRIQEWFDEFGQSAVVADKWEAMGLGYEI
ncbi:MAG: aminotransferase class V-fold PLP-dependent enzyme [Cephaloticoccus sp.]|nr:aminotransferase class V-fold PLP-dependent enzyme [Cephaloticoccus sp.]MCF7760559.1 aminotransferase class V-fold PLP-dependent enzyme [Cephaloticoccus sp.]